MTLLREIKDSLLHLFFPQVCPGCANSFDAQGSLLCLACTTALPETHFAGHAGNPAEHIFRGRLPLAAAAAQYYYTRDSIVQRLMHAFKYKNNKELGLQMGRMMGDTLLKSGRFDADALVPLPLNEKRERKRGFNQAEVLCNGMAEVLKLPVWNNCISRPLYTDTQTKRGRTARWQNIEGKFILTGEEQIRGKTLLLVDDVVTTGATIEACGIELLKAENVTLKLATLCLASR